MLKVTQPSLNSDAVQVTGIQQADCAKQAYINPINFKHIADARDEFYLRACTIFSGFFVGIFDCALVEYIDKYYASGQEIRTKLKRYIALAG
jgi:hypothetical protein